MSIINFLIVALGVLGGGSTVGIILQGIYTRKGRRADVAQSVAAVAESVNDMYMGLQKEMKIIREAVTDLTNRLDDLWPKITNCLTKEEAEDLRKANTKLKIVS